jgi:hypothetical protein
MTKVSQSDFGAFQRCRRLFDYTAPGRKNLMPLKPAKALWLGEGLHFALEHFYKDETDPVQALTTWRDKSMTDMQERGAIFSNAEMDEMRESYLLATGMLRNYQLHYGPKPSNDRDGMRVILTEVEFDVPIPNTNNGHIVGRWDGVVQDADGRYFLIDHKSYSYPPSDDSLLMNPQFNTYVLAANWLMAAGAERLVNAGIPKGSRCWGILWNGMKKGLPTARTTTRFFERQWIRKTLRELDLFADDLRALYLDMTDPALRIYPHVTADCSRYRCPFLLPCQIESRGEDVAWILNENYVDRPPRGDVYIEEL